MKLVVFDVDGTLVDSQGMIVSAMHAGLEAAGLPLLSREKILSIVGLSLPVAVETLLPDVDPDTRVAVVDGYRTAFQQARISDEAPFYPGAEECLRRLAKRNDLLLAIATGKSRRGLDALIAANGLQGLFASVQTADDNPSKPAPGMLFAALIEAGVDAGQAVMVGDTSFDMEMAQAAGMRGIGVDWGYHSRDDLIRAGAERIVHDYAELTEVLEAWADD